MFFLPRARGMEVLPTSGVKSPIARRASETDRLGDRNPGSGAVRALDGWGGVPGGSRSVSSEPENMGQEPCGILYVVIRSIRMSHRCGREVLEQQSKATVDSNMPPST